MSFLSLQPLETSWLVRLWMKTLVLYFSLGDSGVIDLLNFTVRTESDLDLGVLALVATLNVLTEAGWIINLRKGHFAWAHKNELTDNVCVCGARASVFVAILTFTWNPIWKWEGATGNADYREHSLGLIQLISCNSFYCNKTVARAFSQLCWNSLCWTKSKQLSPYHFGLYSINPQHFITCLCSGGSVPELPLNTSPAFC